MTKKIGDSTHITTPTLRHFLKIIRNLIFFEVFF